MKESLKKPAKLGPALIQISKIKPHDLRNFLGVMHFAAAQISSPDSDVRSFAAIDWTGIFPELFVFQFQFFQGMGASISLLEGVALADLIKMVRA